MTTQEAPGRLELVRAFVNTRDLEDEAEALSSPQALERWLRDHGLMHRGEARRRDLVQARKVREALRALLVANNGGGAPGEAALTLSRAAHRAKLRLRFERDGRAWLEPQVEGVDGALGRLLAIAAAAIADASWGRLKACRAEECRWAFYDHARNRSRHWCSMAVCGNRRKARAYRERHAA